MATVQALPSQLVLPVLYSVLWYGVATALQRLFVISTDGRDVVNCNNIVKS